MSTPAWRPEAKVQDIPLEKLMWDQKWHRITQVSLVLFCEIGSNILCVFLDFFSRCNLRLRLQLILSVEISLHQKDLTLEQWEKRSLSGQIFFNFAFPKEIYIITILVYLPISVQGAWTEMLSRRWLTHITKFLEDKGLFSMEEKTSTAVKLCRSDENQ